MSIIIEWDKKKAVNNYKKHFVSFEEASTVFKDILSITIYDPFHSEDEDRFITLGMSCRQHLLVVVHADRNDKIRIISARVAKPRERKDYEKGR